MKRRFVLDALGTGMVGALAGCLGSAFGGGASDPPGSTPTDEPSATPSPTKSGEAVDSVGGVSLPIPMSELNRGAGKDAIPAITEPVFGADWSDFDATLDDDEPVIGVARNGEARAYPLAILNWHEIVNDEFHGPLLVTYCPLCGSGVTAERTVDGQPTIFGVSGLLYQSDLVMYDRKTDSLWSQIHATAIRGPKTGTRLTLLPSTMTTWGAWTDEHPDTEVLLPPPRSGTIAGETSRDYERNPYTGYDESGRIGIGYNSFDDDRLHPKTEVIGITAGDTARAYPLERVAEAGVVNDRVGDRPVVVAVGPGETLVAYVRTVDGEALTFEQGGGDRAHMRGGGSRWRVVTGEAVDGPHEGTTLTRANDRSPMFWFAWADFHPNTELYGGS